jgi:hypothetical protein
MGFLKYIINLRKSDLTPISLADYHKDLQKNENMAKRAFEQAWVTRNFEIELYWKRANYFWAFIASTLVGYFALINSENYRKPDSLDHVEVYFVICIGLVLAVAWWFINIGSKAWQRHWEIHIDLLEDEFTGPLYKTVYPTITYSVSKINEIVSFSFIVIWCLLGAKYFIDNNLINVSSYDRINWLVVLATIGAILAVVSMRFGHGRGRFSQRDVLMYRRGINYQSVSEEPNPSFKR